MAGHPNLPADDAPHEPRFVGVSRRRFLQRSALVGVVVAIPGLACGNDDAEVFADANADAGSAEPTAAAGAGAEATTDDGTAAAGDAAPVSGAILPDGAELIVTFTYVAGESDRGPARNPYLAVWLEDTAGELVDTITVWFEQSGKGTRWIDDLRRWYSTSGNAADTTMAGATRTAGTYSVAWDGTDLAGAPVAQGDYVLFIEAAREHGPYSITSVPITLGADAVTVSFADDGEIAEAGAEFVL